MQLRKLAGPAIACPGSLFAQAGHAAGDSDCQYEVTPCFLAASLDGTVGVRGVKTDIDVPFSDIRDHLEAGFTGLFSAHKGPWTFMPEALYFRLDGDSSGSVTGPFGRVTPDGALDLTNERYIYQGTAGDRVFDSGTTVDLLAAARYTKVKAEMEVRLDTNPGIVFPGGEISADGSKSWTDAWRVCTPSTRSATRFPCWATRMWAEGGSDLTYQFLPGANREFRKDLTAKLGYRQLCRDYEDGGFTRDRTASGARLGPGIRF